MYPCALTKQLIVCICIDCPVHSRRDVLVLPKRKVMQCTDLNSETQCSHITHYYAQRNHFHMGDILDKNTEIHTQKSAIALYVWDWFINIWYHSSSRAMSLRTRINRFVGLCTYCPCRIQITRLRNYK